MYWRKVRPTANPNQEHNFGQWGQSSNKGGKFQKKHDVENKNANAEQKEEKSSIEIKPRNRKKGEKVGDMVYTIGVKELGLSNNSTCVLKNMPKENGGGEHDVLIDDTASSSTSSQSRSP
ncbi:hypothetical protein V6N11_071383 [Hibiscus sabdariffa]|uniref:Uncharacterized protein n=1 Tax=Hibiscus sabdariffa TaxID=183260 RepID=A0ABR2TZY9_9ROSI